MKCEHSGSGSIWFPRYHTYCDQSKGTVTITKIEQIRLQYTVIYWTETQLQRARLQFIPINFYQMSLNSLLKRNVHSGLFSSTEVKTCCKKQQQLKPGKPIQPVMLCIKFMLRTSRFVLCKRATVQLANSPNEPNGSCSVIITLVLAGVLGFLAIS